VKPWITCIAFVVLFCFVLCSIPSGVIEIEPEEIEVKIGTGARATLIVGPGQTYTMIQDAIDNASAGDTVRVWAGTYNENLTLSKTLSLIGNGTNTTQIIGNGNHSVITVYGKGCNITGFNITGSGNGSGSPRDSGILVYSNNNTIEGCNINNNYHGINLYFSDYCVITNTTCISNSAHGIALEYSSCNWIGNCTSNSNNIGIKIIGAYDNVIIDNIFNSNIANGIDLEWHVDNTQIFNNTCNSNGDNGIMMSWGSCDGNLVINCTIINNSKNGVFIESWNAYYNEVDNSILNFNNVGINIYQPTTSYTSVTNNKIGFNTWEGVRCTGSSNVIYHNSFEGNNFGGVQAHDSGSNNLWDKGYPTGGNYWSDWTSPDQNSDGFVDKPYNISGGVGSQDKWPTTTHFGHPLIITDDILEAYEDFIYSVTYIATDVDTSSEFLNWSFKSNATWLTFSNQNVLEGTPRNDDVGTYWVNISVSDGNYSDSTYFDLLVYNTNDAPVITTPPVTACLEDELYYVDLEAYDVDPTADTIYWTIREGPYFLDIDTDTGELSGTPGNSAVGSYHVNISVDDGFGPLFRDYLEYDLTVLNVNDPPVIDYEQYSISVFEDYHYIAYFNALDIDPTNDFLTWSLKTDADFLEIDTVFGDVSGTPLNEDIGKYWVNVTVSDGNGGRDYRNFSLTVHDTNDAPFITTGDVTVCYEDRLYYVDYNATDVDPSNDTLEWGLETNADFLWINEPFGVLSGTPNNEDVGFYWVKITVKDPWGGEDDRNFTLEVRNTNDPPVGSDETLTFKEDCGKQVYNIHNIFFDMDGDALYYNISGGDKLDVSLNDPFLEFTPPPNWNGWEELTLTATDGEYKTSAIVKIQILPVNDPPHSVLIVGVDDGARIKSGTVLNLTALVSDVDLDHEGDSFRYTWLSNISGTLGLNDTLEDLILPLGHHLISLRVRDQGNVETHVHIEVIVEDETGPVIPTDDDEEEEEPDRELGKTTSTILVLAMILIPLLITIIILVLIILRSREEGPPEDEIVEGLGEDLEEDEYEDDFDYDDEDIQDEPDEYEFDEYEVLERTSNRRKGIFDDDLDDLADEDSLPFDDQDIVADEIDIEDDE
jgi:parallel beta-helix repeat protein